MEGRHGGIGRPEAAEDPGFGPPWCADGDRGESDRYNNASVAEKRLFWAPGGPRSGVDPPRYGGSGTGAREMP